MSDTTRKLRRDAAPARTVRRDNAEVGDARIRSTRAWRRTVLIVGLLVAAVVAHASLRVPCGPSAGGLDVKILAASAPSHMAARMMLGTYNIHGGKGTDGVRNLNRIADVLKGLDFAGLNEVHGPALWERDDQATSLGRTLRMTPLFAPTESRWYHARFGNGLLTRLDVEHWQVVPLPRVHGKSHRNLVHVRARAANGAAVNLVVTHLDRSDDRERRDQLRTAVHYFTSLAEPAVLMGDLNSDGDEPLLKALVDEGRAVDALAAKMRDRTPRHIDWILVRGARVSDAGLMGAGPSDHPHVWAELQIPPAAGD